MPEQSAEPRRQLFHMSEEEYLVARNEDGGRCIACGAEAYGCEPDAREYPCGECDENHVYGIEELMLMGLVVIDTD